MSATSTRLPADANRATCPALSPLDYSGVSTLHFIPALALAAVFSGVLGDFSDGAPSTLKGDLALHGVTAPVALDITHFKCIMHPMLNREVCGADALGTFQRDIFGLTIGKEYGFDMTVTLRIQVEVAVRE